MRKILLLAALVLAACATAPSGPRPEAAAAHTMFDGVPVNGVGLDYPQQLQDIGAEGTVALTCAITKTGETRDCMVLRSTDHRFDVAALRFLQSARYHPPMRDGKAVAIDAHPFHIQFKLTAPPNSFAAARIAPASTRTGFLRPKPRETVP